MTIAFLNPATVSKPIGYSHVAVVGAGRQAHISGQVAFDACGALVGRGDIAAQAEQVYANLATALAAAIRAVRMKFLGDGPYPASTMVGVTALVHPDMLIEIEVIAALD